MRNSWSAWVAMLWLSGCGFDPDATPPPPAPDATLEVSSSGEQTDVRLCIAGWVGCVARGLASVKTVDAELRLAPVQGILGSTFFARLRSVPGGEPIEVTWRDPPLKGVATGTLPPAFELLAPPSTRYSLASAPPLFQLTGVEVGATLVPHVATFCPHADGFEGGSFSIEPVQLEGPLVDGVGTLSLSWAQLAVSADLSSKATLCQVTVSLARQAAGTFDRTFNRGTFLLEQVRSTSFELTR